MVCVISFPLFFVLISFCSFIFSGVAPLVWCSCFVVLLPHFIFPRSFFVAAVSILFIFSLPIPSSCTATPPPSNNPSDRRFPDTQGFDAASGLSEGFSDTAAKYTRGSTEPKRFFAIFMGPAVRFSGLIFLS